MSVSTMFWPTMAAAQQHTVRTSKAPLSWDPTSLLLSRFGFGASAATRAELTHYGPDQWWSRQLAFSRGPGAGYAGHASIAAHGPLLSRTPAVVRSWMKLNGNEFGWDLMDQLAEVTMGLQAWSPGQVYETVVDFFANHLNVANHSDGVWTCRHLTDRDVIRKHALGSFTDMLLASARDPAMLQYLSLALSSKTAVNENHGRELLELHTVGLGAHYTESDVQNSAKILTGRTFDGNYNYVYDPKRHWTGYVQVLGFKHDNATAEGGEAVADAYLRYLAKHPSTAQHLAQKLCVHYVSDTPSAELVAGVAKAYLDGGTQIVPMLEKILHSTEFWASRGQKVRRPNENLIASVRALGVEPGDRSKSLKTLHWMSYELGHLPLDWTAPNGYPDVAAAWRSSGSLVDLWTYHRGLTQNWFDGLRKLDTMTLFGGVTPKTSGEAIKLLCTRLTGSAFIPEHAAALQAFMQEPADTPFASSMFRWYRDHLIPLILDSAQHALT